MGRDTDLIEMRLAALEGQADEILKLLGSLSLALSSVGSLDQAQFIGELFRVGVLALRDEWRGPANEGRGSNRPVPAPHKLVW